MTVDLESIGSIVTLIFKDKNIGGSDIITQYHRLRLFIWVGYHPLYESRKKSKKGYE